VRDTYLAPVERVAKLHGDGSPAHRRALAAAEDAMRGPEFPEELAHLFGWSLELVGRSGDGAPLMYQTISHWACLTHRSPSALEVDALIKIDTAMRAPVDLDKVEG
jgi:hypothetical protein